MKLLQRIQNVESSIVKNQREEKEDDLFVIRLIVERNDEGGGASFMTISSVGKSES